ncbi:DUF427 domain-containing protein [soil metagenome]
MPTSHDVRVEESPRRVRGTAGGAIVIDTTRPLFVWDRPSYPHYYVARADVDESLLVEGDEPGVFDLVVGSTTEKGAARVGSAPELSGHLHFRWDALDHWFEEDEEVFVHPRDPYKRVDILRSSRRVRVEIGGVELADTTGASFLYETGLPVRYYLPKTDVRFRHLTPSARETACPYKGVARYWNVEVGGAVHPDVVWGYDFPVPESQRIAGLVCFYNEKVDIYLDEVKQERPSTPFG